MDDEQKLNVAASLLCHEQLLGFLLAEVLRQMPAQDQERIERALFAPAQVPDLGDHQLDIDTADQLAGFAILRQDAMRRVFQEARRLAANFPG